MSEDYSDLLDKEVTYTSTKGTFVGKVVGIDKDIGITIIEKDNPDHYLCCLRSPFVMKIKMPDTTYNTIFKFLVQEIRDGEVSADNHQKITPTVSWNIGHSPSIDTCAFN